MLRTNRINVRGVSYEVSEPSGASFQAITKVQQDEKTRHRVQGITVLLCCVDPKFDREEAALQLPQAAISAIFTEAFRLMNEDEESPKAVPVATMA